jgi:hypothetical protein
MRLSKELYSNIVALKAIKRVLEVKGRKNVRIEQTIENARKTLSGSTLVEFDKLIETIRFSFNYPDIRLKAIHNQRNNDPDRRKARVLSFLESNPNHPLVKGD